MSLILVTKTDNGYIVDGLKPRLFTSIKQKEDKRGHIMTSHIHVISISIIIFYLFIHTIFLSIFIPKIFWRHFLLPNRMIIPLSI
ncbi:hypothetical protein L6452_16873 [Arctium lappa]|uniref:Uncharacterized protein n=1 Tax=Arctium lappa TaxID=4217 RepID=A0ACB9C1Z8_ARCLA|nr:hypothetical protein L6452_16873 [Arctium lappa]